MCPLENDCAVFRIPNETCSAIRWGARFKSKEIIFAQKKHVLSFTQISATQTCRILLPSSSSATPPNPNLTQLVREPGTNCSKVVFQPPLISIFCSQPFLIEINCHAVLWICKTLELSVNCSEKLSFLTKCTYVEKEVFLGEYMYVFLSACILVRLFIFPHHALDCSLRIMPTELFLNCMSYAADVFSCEHTGRHPWRAPICRNHMK